MATTTTETRKKKPAATTKRTRKTTTKAAIEPTKDAIALRARELFVKAGYPGGRDVEFWLEAERQLKEELAG